MAVYAGIGSRETPPDILDLMARLAARLEQDGWHLHSGGADGADQAFQSGCSDHTIFTAQDAEWDCIWLSSHFHPAWHRCGEYARRLHGRNAYIVLGRDLITPVSFIACWTPNAAISGGTGQALRIARHYHIPVRNLADPIHRAAAEEYAS